MPLIIGLTGGIASGKTKVSDYFSKQYNIDVIDADIVAREVVALGTPALTQIHSRYGDQVLTKQAQLDRAYLRQIIFSSPAEKQWLEDLLHPLIRKTMKAQLQQASSPYALMVAPLLIENKLQSMVDRILVVDVSRETQIQRTISRDDVTQAHVEKILNAQVSQAQRLSYADDIIDNNENLSSEHLQNLTQQIDKLHQKYLNLAAQKIR